MPRQVKNKPTREQKDARELPAPVVTPNREQRAAAAAFRFGFDAWLEDGPIARWIEDGHERAVARDAIPLAQLLASRDAAAEARGRLLERADVVRYLRSFADVDVCNWDPDVKIERGDHLAQPKESATPAVDGTALEQKLCGLCGGSGDDPEHVSIYQPKCGRCHGTGKEPT